MMSDRTTIAERVFAMEPLSPFGVALRPSDGAPVDIVSMTDVPVHTDQLIAIARRHTLAVFHDIGSDDFSSWQRIPLASDNNTTHIPHLDGRGKYPALLWAGASSNRPATNFVRMEAFLKAMRSQKHLLDGVSTESYKDSIFSSAFTSLREELESESILPLLRLHAMSVDLRNDMNALLKLRVFTPSLVDVCARKIGDWYAHIRGVVPEKDPDHRAEMEADRVCYDALQSLKDAALETLRDETYVHAWSDPSCRDTAVLCCNGLPTDDVDASKFSALHFAALPEKPVLGSKLFRKIL